MGQAGYGGGTLRYFKAVSECNDKLSHRSSNRSVNNPFLRTASIYIHNWSFTLHVDVVISLTILKSEIC